MEAREKKLRRVGARVAHDQRNSNFERCVEVRAISDGGEASQVCRSAQDDLYGTFKNVIGAIFTAVMQRAVFCAV